MAGVLSKRTMLITRGHLITPLFLGSMFVYPIFRNGPCLNDVRVRSYDLGSLTTWLYTSSN